MTIILTAALWLAILLFKARFARRALRQPPATGTVDFAQITVVQPILSGDPALASVLESNLLSLVAARFLWLIDKDDPEAAVVTARLQARYPQRAIEIIAFDAAPEGINPKLFKLEQARPTIGTPYLLVLDDDAHLTAPALQQMMLALDDHSLVTALPWYRAAGNRSSALLAQFVNDNSALTYLPLLPFTQPLTLNGMCYVISSTTLAQTGGFAPILRHLTDDLALATHLTRHHVRLVQSVAPVCVQTSIVDAGAYFRQMHRWFLFATLLLREKRWSVKLLIALLQGVHPVLLWAMIIQASSGGIVGGSVLVISVLLRLIILRRIQRAVSPTIPLRPGLSLLSELLQPVHLLHALINRTICWRSRRYRVYDNDRFSSL